MPNMRRPSVDDMLEGKQSKYALVIAVAKRARQIADTLPEDSKDKPVLLAIDDFKNHKFDILEPDIND